LTIARSPVAIRLSANAAAPSVALATSLSSLQSLMRFPREDAGADYECGHDRPENHQWHELHCRCGVLRRLTPPLRAIIRRSAYQVLRNSPGSLAMSAAILRASSLLSNFAADRRSGSFE